MTSNGTSAAPIPVLDHAAFLDQSRAKRLKRAPKGHFIHAMYNSLIDAIVTDPELMVIPLDDHSFVRGHAVFDTASLVNGRVYRLGIHLDRLFKSAKDSRLTLPFGATEEENRKKMTEVVCQVCVASGRKYGSVRFWLSAGPGNFGFTTEGCEPAFYCVLCGSDSGPPHESKILDEVLVEDVPIKPTLLAQLKSNNYMLNCLTAMSAQERGGCFGIQLKNDGTVGEGCVANCAIVTQDDHFVTPEFVKILSGTTVRKAMELARKHLLTTGLLKGIEQRVVKIEELRGAKELMMLCGDLKVFGVRNFDGKQVGTNDDHPVAHALQKLIAEDAENGSEEHIELKY
jgi:4-amino-4-deoxychorismate lyase